MSRAATARLSAAVRNTKPSPTLGIMNRMRAMKAEGRRVYSLGFGESPFPVPAPVAEALRRNAHRNEYLPVQGLPALREEVAGFLNRSAPRGGAEFAPGDVVIGPGSKELMFLFQLALEADLVLPAPSWVSYEPQARMLGRRVSWLPTPAGDWRLQADELERLCAAEPDRARVLALNYPSNPTGLNFTRGELEALADVCRRHGVLVISDEIYFQLTTDAARPHVSMAAVYPEGTVVVGGMSKSFGAGGWRVGHMAFPAELADVRAAVCAAATSTFSSVCTPVQLAAVVAYRGGPDIDAYLEQSRAVVKAVTGEVARRLVAAGVLVTEASGAFYLFPDFSPFREGLRARGIATSDELLARLVADTGVAMLPGTAFGMEPESLTARLCAVDFDGAHALEVAGRGVPMDAGALDDFARHQLEAIDVLVEWLGSRDEA